MKRLLLALAILLFAVNAWATGIEVTFFYEGEATAYNLYSNSTLFATAEVSAVNTTPEGFYIMSFVKPLEVGEVDFFMTATRPDGTESLASNTVTLDIPEPVIPAGPPQINSIRIVPDNGEELIFILRDNDT